MTEDDSVELITDRSRILQILKTLTSTRTMMPVVMGTTESEFTSKVLEVDPENNRIVLDRLVPLEGNDILKAEHPFSIEGKIQGIPIKFTSRVHAVEEEDGTPYYVCDFPEHIVYDQRRRHYRATLHISARPNVILTGEDILYKGLVEDLSQSGATIILVQEPDVDHGQEIDCEIEFQDEDNLDCRVSIRHIEEKTAGRTTHWTLGIEFNSLGKAEYRALQRWLMEVERKRLRSRSV